MCDSKALERSSWGRIIEEAKVHKKKKMCDSNLKCPTAICIEYSPGVYKNSCGVNYL
jgi:hypothetical protein